MAFLRDGLLSGPSCISTAMYSTSRHLGPNARHQAVRVTIGLTCQGCKGLVKPDIVFFGAQLAFALNIETCC